MRKLLTSKIIFTPLISALLTVGAVVQVQAKGRETPAPVFIKTGKMWDSDKVEFVYGRTIKVVGKKITEVSATMTIPAGSQVIDLTKNTVLPGLIDAHTHLLLLQTLSESSMSNMSMDLLKPTLVEGDALRALHGAARAKTFIEAGITTVQDLGNSGQFGDVALKTAINDGSIVGPRMRVSGPGLSAVGGQFPGILPRFQHLVDSEYHVIRNVEDGVQAVRLNLNMGVDVIKVFSDSKPNRSQLSIDEMTGIAKEAHRYGIRVTAHCVSDVSARNAVLAGIDGIDHLYEVTDETLKLIKEKGVIVIPTYLDKQSFLQVMGLLNVAPKEELETAWSEELKGSTDRIQRLLKFGIPIASGSDSYADMKMPQGQAAKRVLYAYAECGMPVKDILKSTSVTAARHLGMTDRIGVIKANAFADIIAVEGDPEQDIHCLDKVAFVMKDGQIFVGK